MCDCPQNACGVPWNNSAFDGWLIVGMNHYRISGQRWLFVAMAKDGRCIKTEGPDNKDRWDELAYEASRQ